MEREMCIRRALIFGVACISIGAPLAVCQTAPSESFDAVAVKRWTMEDRGKLGVEVSGGRLEARAVTLKDLIAEAYSANDYGIAGTSSWMETERYNIYATAGRPATRSELRVMLQHMLANRFQLMIHHAPKQTKIYALAVDKGGPKLIPRDQPFHFAAPTSDEMQFDLGNTIQRLVRWLNAQVGRNSVGRPVVDRTGLTGEYQIVLTFGNTPNPDGPGGTLDIDYPTALKRQLGLRLDPVEESYDQIVVDSAAKPELD
jgi:uncharacterized protein (TIGR03435 family)